MQSSTVGPYGIALVHSVLSRAISDNILALTERPSSVQELLPVLQALRSMFQVHGPTMFLIPIVMPSHSSCPALSGIRLQELVTRLHATSTNYPSSRNGDLKNRQIISQAAPVQGPAGLPTRCGRSTCRKLGSAVAAPFTMQIHRTCLHPQHAFNGRPCSCTEWTASGCSLSV